MNMKTQCEKVLEYLEKHQSISQAEANKKSISRLASRICDLKRMGYPITSEYKTGKNMDGETVRFKVYYLASKEKE